MEFTRVDKKYVNIPVTATLADGAPAVVTAIDVALLTPRARPTAATTWTASSYAAGIATVLIAGPDADPAGALVLPGAGADVYIRLTDNPEVDAKKVGRISVC